MSRIVIVILIYTLHKPVDLVMFLFETRRFRDWILYSSSGGTYPVLCPET
jgi:hypothetical protein